MNEITAGEILVRREQLEENAAQILGRMQFEFSRLDTNIGLCAVWVDSGHRLEELNQKVVEMTFHKRLKFVERAVRSTFLDGSEAQSLYLKWINRANTARTIRNQLVHGRWDVDPYTNQVVNILGLPTSHEQRSIKYTIAELDSLLMELQALQSDLNKIRKRWPL